MPSTRQVCALFVAIVVVLTALPAAAQTVTLDPRTAEFDPSPDHNDPTLVARYELEFYFVGASQPFQTANLGKPAPQADGKIRVDLLTVLGAFPPAGSVYEARVAAVSQESAYGRSTVSNQFQFTSSCNATILPTSSSIGAGAATGTVTVTAVAGCSWTASSGVPWITITSGASGTGNGTVAYSVAANTSTTPRSGTLSIAGQTFIVDQAAACAFTISPTSASWSASAATGTVAVTTTPGCFWSVTNPAAWITVTSSLPVTGSGTVTYAVAANASTTARSATLTIAGRAFSVSQAGVVCTPSLSATQVTLPAGGGTGSVSVTVASGCAWQTTSVPSWITINSGSSGNGNGTVTYTVAPNPSTSSRSDTLTIAGLSYLVTQEGVACTFSISPTSGSVPFGASTGTVAVTAPAGCAWTAVSGAGFVSVTGGATGSGNGTVSYSVAANPSINPRNGSITIAGHTFAIAQAGAPCTLSIVPTSTSIAAGAASGSIAVTVPTGCAWTATNNAPSWITLTGATSGNGNGTVTYTVAANPSATPRSGTISIQGQTFTVNQAGVPCTYQISPTGASVGTGATSGTVTVTAPSGCAWTASAGSMTWVTITGGASGSGNGTVTYSIAANTSINSRSGNLTIAGQTFALTQAGIPCTYQLSPTGASIGAGATTGTVGVTAPTGCTWTASSGAPSWVTITGGASGTGNGTVTYGATANTTTSPRTATLTIAGQGFVLTQAGGTCSFTLTPPSESLPDTGGDRTISVAVQAGCAWTAVPSASWITITSGGSGNGGGTISYSVAANPSTSGRSGTIAAGGRVVTITQAGAPCSYGISPGSVSVSAAAASGTVTVTSQAGCTWTATSNAAWITVSGGSGTGNGTFNYTIAANPGSGSRTGTVSIGGQTFSVTQAGVPCTFQIAPTGASITAAATTGTVNVTSSTGCNWTATSNAGWITVTGGGSGSGNGTVSYSITANQSTTGRTGTVTIAGQAFTVTQAGAVCSYSVSPATVVLSAAGSTFGVDVATAGSCAWTASSSASWLTIASGGGPGSGRVTFNVAANTTGVERSGTVTVANQTVTVTQAGGSCEYSISPILVYFGPDGATSTVAITTQANCPWTASSPVPWVTFPSGASGAGSSTLTYTVEPNGSTIGRGANLVIAGRTLVLSQTGRICSYALAPSAVTVNSSASSGSFAVTASTGCTWTPTSSAPWISVSGGGVGSGNVTYAIQPNTTGATRTASVTVGNTTFSVTQLGPCDFSISPTAVTVGNDATGGFVSVTAAAGCSWTAASAVPWVTITGGASGTGSGTVSYNVSANSTASLRTGTLNIAGSAFTVTQSPCQHRVTPPTITVPASATTTYALVSTAPSCPWTASSDSSWITFPDGTNGSGTGWITLRAAANSGAARAGIVSAGTGTVVVIQEGTCTFSVAPNFLTIAGAGGQSSLSLTTGSSCAWSALSLGPWITINQGSTSGTGSRAVLFTVAPNPDPTARTSWIVVGGITVTITQNSSAGTLTAPSGLRIIR